MTLIIEERFTAQTLLKWRPSELRLVRGWCRAAKVDMSLLLRGTALAVVRDPLKAIKWLQLPADVMERLQQLELPLEGIAEAQKPAQKPRKQARGKRGGRHARRAS